MGQLLEGRLTGNIQPNDSKNLTEGDIYEFSRFSVIHNSRHRKLTQLLYYIQTDQKTNIERYSQRSDISSSQFISSELQKSIAVSHYTHILTRSTIVKLILCNKQAADFSILQRKKDRKFRVVIITSIIPKLFQGKLLLRSSPATNFYFNKSIDYIKHFKK
ncbi:hypothetical protein YC2023_061630 [Brassica napus]